MAVPHASARIAKSPLPFSAARYKALVAENSRLLAAAAGYRTDIQGLRSDLGRLRKQVEQLEGRLAKRTAA